MRRLAWHPPPHMNLYASLSLLWMYVNTLYVPVHLSGPLAEPALHCQTVPCRAPTQILMDTRAVTSDSPCQHQVHLHLEATGRVPMSEMVCVRVLGTGEKVCV